MPTPTATDPQSSPAWPHSAPPSPPYIEGPLRFPDPATPAPGPVFVQPPQPPPLPAQPASAAPGRRPLAIAAILTVVAFLLAFGVSRVLVSETSTTTTASPAPIAAPTTTAPTSSTSPTTAARRPPLTTSPSTAPRTLPSPPTTQTTPGASPTTTPLPDLSAASAKVIPGVVDIVSQLPGGTGAGTGIVISDSGDVVTNNHVVDGATQIQATVTTTGQTYTATVVGTNATQDIAVVHLAAAHSLATVTVGNSDAVTVGDPVAAVGNAGGAGGAPAVAAGRVTALHAQVTASDENGGNVQTLTDLIQTDARVVPGDSGGPLINDAGAVIGIDVAASAANGRSTTQQTEGFAIPANRAMTIAKQLEANPTGGAPGAPTVGSGYLGVETTNATAPAGALVRGVQPNAPGADIGLQASDVITAIDQTPITNAAALSSALANHNSGDHVTLTWQANDGTHHATATLAAR